MSDEEHAREVALKYHEEGCRFLQSCVGTRINLDDPEQLEKIQAGLRVLQKVEPELLIDKDHLRVFRCPQDALVELNQQWTEGVGAPSIDPIHHDLAATELLGVEVDPDTLATKGFAQYVHDCILFVTDEESEGVTALIEWPDELHLDDNGRLTRSDGPAIRWGDRQKEYFWHAQPIDEIVVERKDKVTAEYLLGLSAEKRRASYEVLGHDRVLRILGAKVIDSDTDGDGLHYELYATDHESWLRMQSPPLQDGSQPYYVEPVHEDCKTCESARGWRATGEVESTVTYLIQT